MYQESEKLYLIKLKNLLQSKYLYLLLILFSTLFVMVSVNRKDESIYSIEDNVFYLKVLDYKIKDNKITLKLKGNENLVANYYFKDESLIKDIRYGILVKVKGKLRIPSNTTVPHTFNYKKYLSNNKINYLLTVNEIEVIKEESFLYKVKNYIKKRIDKIDKTGYMEAFILGDKSLIEDENYSNYKSIGITHLFAISGMHIGLLSGVLLKLLKKLNNVLKYVIIDVFLVMYGFVVCFPASIRRCILFYVIASINKVFHLDLSNKRILVLTVIFLIILDPFIIYDTGFLFSVSTVGGIIFCSDFINKGNAFVRAFKLSLIAFLFSLPINLYSFYEINLLSIFYNLIFIPFISIIVYPLSILSFIFPFLSFFFYNTIKLLEWSSSVLSNIKVFNLFLSFNLIEVILFYFGLYLVFIKQQKWFACLLNFIVLVDIIIPFFDKSSYIYYLDVGQGDATLLISPNRKKVTMIDTGGLNDYEIGDRYFPLLKYLGIKKIDNLILTHGDYDHMGEAINLVNNFKVEKVIFNCGPFNDLEQDLIKVLDKKKIKYYSCIKELNIDKNKLYFLQTKEYDNENDNSNVIYTELDGYKFMFMGDASTITEKEILDKYVLLDIDVLKVGHHGSRTSSGKEFIYEMNPKYSIISVGKNNRYGHPNKEVLNNLRDSKIYRTDKNGSVVFRIKNDLVIDVYSP